jgi:uncharacterized Zn-finger protein
MPNEKVPCPFCGQLVWAFYPEGTYIKGVEKKARVFLSGGEKRTPANCPECGSEFWVYYLES